jgi:hypothetical protein
MKKFFKNHKWQLTTLSLLAIIALLASMITFSPSAIVKKQWGNVITIGSEVSASTTADFTATGTAAQQTATFQTALNDLPSSGGILNILSGTFTFNATVTRAIANVTIEGIGMSTIFTNNASTPIFTAGGNGWAFISFATDAGGISTGSYTYYSNDLSINGTMVSNNIGATGRTASYVIAASNSSSLDKSQADAVCTGTNDDVIFQAALNANYQVIVADFGTYNFSNTCNLINNNTIIEGNNSTFNDNGSTPIFSTGVGGGIINVIPVIGGSSLGDSEQAIQQQIAQDSGLDDYVPATGDPTGCVFRDFTTDAGGLYCSTLYTTIQNCTLGSYYIGLSVPNSLNNTIFGLNALQSNTTGNNNSAFGQGALYSNTTGNYNSAFGQGALYSNTTGNNNSAFGLSALQSNTTGNYNSAFGQVALYRNTTGSYNSALGLNALGNNTTGNYNLALGLNAGLYNTTVSNQLFINTLDQGNYTNDVSNSLIYGIFNATPSNQVLSLNAGTINMDYLPTSNPHVVGKLWNNSGTLMVSGG